MVRPSLLIIGADPDLKAILLAELSGREIDPLWAADLVEARAQLKKSRPNAILIDYAPVGAAALEMITEAAAIEPSVPIITVLSEDDLRIRVEAARRGTRLLLQKPISGSELGEGIARVLNQEGTLQARVLVLSHQEQVREKTKQAITSERIRVSVLDDAVRFWDTIEEQSPNLLILDVDMPQFSGLDLCRVVRADVRWNWVPVILISSRTDLDTIHNIFAAGADDFIPVDFQPTEIMERVWNRLERNYFNKNTFESDLLTGLTTRRQSSNTLNQFLKIAERQHQPFTFCILDIDHFKLVNDEFGHAVGDLVLQRFGRMLSRSLRSEDVVARWGGEEFVIGMYGVTRDAGITRLQRLLESWRQEAFQSPAGGEFHTSFSAGIAEFPADGTGLQHLYRAADEALYAAKITGRNRVRSASASAEPLPDLPTVALVDIDEATISTLRSCFKQFGVLTKAISMDEIERLKTEPFTGAVVPVFKDNERIANALLNGKATSSLITYGLFTEFKQLGSFPVMLSGAFSLPMDRAQVIRSIRTSFQLLKKELRRHVRIPLVTQASIDSANGGASAITQEISAGGMSVISALEINASSPVRLSLALPGEANMSINGVVTWARKDSRVFGVSFAATNGELDRLHSWVDGYLDNQLAEIGSRAIPASQQN
jgi:diguanylate cyclase (GGDEF)-like protein